MEIFLGTEKVPWKHPDKIQKKSTEKFQEKESYWSGKHPGTFLGSREEISGK